MPTIAQCYRFVDHGGETCVAGKADWPDMIRLELRGKAAMWQVLRELLAAMEYGHDEVTIPLFGELTREKDE